MRSVRHASTLALALLLGACATSDPNSTAGRDTAVGAVIGGLAGAAIGAATGSERVGRDAAIGAGVGAAGGYIWSRHMEEQRKAMEQATQGTGVGVSRTGDNQLKLDIPSDISFDSGKYAIKGNFRPVLDRFAQTLNANPVTTVHIIGHTDSTGSDAINDPLSVNRAASTRNYLTNLGVAGSRIAIDGRGSREPIADNTSNAGRAKNRRVEIFVAEAAPANAPAGKN